MGSKFKTKNFDEVFFIKSGKETKELLKAKEYLQNIQMTMNIGDVDDSLFYFEDLSNITDSNEIEFLTYLKESIFSKLSLKFLFKNKLLISSEGLDINLLENASFDAKDNYEYMNANLVKHVKEFITAIWDCILLLKLSQQTFKDSVLLKPLNELFIELTLDSGGKEEDFIKKDNNLEMICELALFLQFYLPDFSIYLIKSQADISCKDKLKKINKDFVKTINKSKKIEHKREMLKQIKSNNSQYLLKLLITQLNTEIETNLNK